MLKIHYHQRGATLFWLIVIVVIVVWGMITLFNRINNTSPVVTEQASEVATAESNSTTPQSATTTKSFTPVNGYNTSRGKAVITEDKFGTFDISIAVVMPSEFPSTYYFAKLIGSTGNSDVFLGKLSKTGGTFTSQYSSTKTIDAYSGVVIWVDGEAETVEGKKLPHDVMKLDF